MRTNLVKLLRPMLRLALCVVALTVWIGDLNPAAAMGGFGRGGGFGRPGFGMGFGPRRPIVAPRRSGGRIVSPRGPGHHRIVGGGGGEPGPGVSGQGRQPAGGNGHSGVPPQGERRFVPDEVITEISPAATPQSIGQIARRYDLTQLEVQRFPLIGATFYRWRLNGRRSVADTVGALEDERIVMSAQPNYHFQPAGSRDKIRVRCAGRCRPIRAGEIADRPGTSNRDGKECSGRGDRFRNRCEQCESANARS